MVPTPVLSIACLDYLGVLYEKQYTLHICNYKQVGCLLNHSFARKHVVV